MNKTKIEWADMTWNPVTGCLHNCEYCYARKIANRFGGHMSHDYKENNKKIHELGEALVFYNPEARKAPYPFDFEPTFHKYKLNEPARKTKGRNIFVCSMADLFGDWVPQEWIEEVFDACSNAQRHNYLFLTKNVEGYEKAIDNYAVENRGSEDCIEFFKNFWFGISVTNRQDLLKVEKLADLEEGHRFLSIEPLLEPLELHFTKDRCPICGSSEVYQENPITAIDELTCFCASCTEWASDNLVDLRPSIDWVIIGAESGNRKNKVIPKKEWIDNIVDECKRYEIPVFMKDSLILIMGEKNMLREFPEGLRR